MSTEILTKHSYNEEDSCNMAYTASVVAPPVNIQTQNSDIVNIENTDSGAFAVAVSVPLTFYRRFIIYEKKCILFKPKYGMFRENQNKWIIFKFNEDNESKYKLTVTDPNQLYNLAIKLGFVEGKYRIKLRNQNNIRISMTDQNTLWDTIIWCYNTEHELSNVEIIQ